MPTLLAWWAVFLAAGGPPALTRAEIARRIRELDSPKFGVREQATKRLLQIGRPAIGPLDRALAKMPPEGRLRAERILRQLDPPRAPLERIASPVRDARRDALLEVMAYRRDYLVEPLVKRLREETDADCLRWVVQALGFQCDRRATKPLLAALSVRRSAGHLDLLHVDILTALGDIGDPEAIGPLLRYREAQKRPPAKDERGRERTLHPESVRGNEALAKALGGTRDPRAVPVLLELSAIAYDGAGGGFVDRAVHEALARIGPAALPQLAKAIHHPRDGVRTLVARALGRIGDRRATDTLVRMLDDPVPWVGGAAAVSLDRLGNDKGAAWILVRLRDPKKPGWRDHEVSEAWRALAACTHPNLRPFCERTLRQGGDLWEGYYAAEALVRMGSEEGLDWLRALLKKEDQVSFAVHALLSAGAKEMVPDLIRLATHKRQDIAQSAIPALGECGTPEAAEALLRLARGPEQVRGYARIKRDAVYALGKIRTRKVAAALVELLTDPDEQIARAAHGALAEIAGINPGLGVAGWRAWLAYHRDDLPAD